MGARHLTFSREWSGLVKTADSIRSDGPQARLDFSSVVMEELENFYSGSISAARAWVDVAGGSGGLSVGITESCPNIQVTVVDLGSTIPPRNTWRRLAH
mgnify:CR=1 FL=1